MSNAKMSLASCAEDGCGLEAGRLVKAFLWVRYFPRAMGRPFRLVPAQAMEPFLQPRSATIAEASIERQRVMPGRPELSAGRVSGMPDLRSCYSTGKERPTKAFTGVSRLARLPWKHFRRIPRRRAARRASMSHKVRIPPNWSAARIELMKENERFVRPFG